MFKTREVAVGKVKVGGSNPIRMQSMTTSPTDHVEQTVEQIIKLADWGCEIVRVTVQGKKEAYACESIKNTLLKKGYSIPVVADIHFYPPAAMIVADFVDKVRINPGNFADRRATFKTIEYTDESYAQEIEKIEEKFAPLVLSLKKQKKSMRIGCNHGSLSDRIMNRYGDTPQGMVESAFEFTRVARKYDYHDIIYSMKASNPSVMIQAYRLLVEEQIKLGWNYPIHLGVTEAGDGEDGRIKSAIGIGSLLLDGIGDTIRVSLTEDPWFEIDPCKRLIELARKYHPLEDPLANHLRVEFKRREVLVDERLPLHRDSSVALMIDQSHMSRENLKSDVGLKEGEKELLTADFVLSKDRLPSLDPVPCFSSPLSLSEYKELKQQELFGQLKHFPTIVKITEKGWEDLKQSNPDLIFLAFKHSRVHQSRLFFEWMEQHQMKTPVILNFHYEGDWEDTMIQASMECGSLLCDGLGDGLALEGSYDLSKLRILMFNILQGCRRRTVKTEFISCPSCGRTLFDLQSVTARIRKKTSHLPGVKIAIMGCIVNGPGEMADADFGYVGSLPGKVDLYVGKTCVKRGIDFKDADDKLIELIQEHGLWKEPETVTEVVSH